MDPTASVSVNAMLYRLVARFCAPSGALGLDGVCFEPAEAGGALLIAGDGTDLIVLRDPKGYAEDCYTVRTPRLLLDAIDSRAPGRDSHRTKIEIRGGRAWLSPDDLSVPIGEPQRGFAADWRQTMQVLEASAPVEPDFSARSLNRIEMTMRALARLQGADADAAAFSRVIFRGSDKGVSAAEFRGHGAFVLSFHALADDDARATWRTPEWLRKAAA